MSTVRKSHSRMLAVCSRRNSVQLGSRRCGAGSIPASQDRPDRARPDPDAEPEQLALDPPVAPTRVLARESNDQFTNLGRRRRATGTAMRIRPAARHQLTMPAQKRRRRDHERSPRPPRQYPAEGSKQRSISLAQPRTSHLTLEHEKLMAQQQDLDLLLPLRAKPQNDQLEQAPQRPIQKRQNHTPRTPRHLALTLPLNHETPTRPTQGETEVPAPHAPGDLL